MQASEDEIRELTVAVRQERIAQAVLAAAAGDSTGLHSGHVKNGSYADAVCACTWCTTACSAKFAVWCDTSLPRGEALTSPVLLQWWRGGSCCRRSCQPG